MKQYIYKPTGAVVTAPDGKYMAPELFGEISAKPKARTRKKPAAKEDAARK